MRDTARLDTLLKKIREGTFLTVVDTADGLRWRFGLFGEEATTGREAIDRVEPRDVPGGIR